MRICKGHDSILPSVFFPYSSVELCIICYEKDRGKTLRSFRKDLSSKRCSLASIPPLNRDNKRAKKQKNVQPISRDIYNQKLRQRLEIDEQALINSYVEKVRGEVKIGILLQNYHEFMVDRSLSDTHIKKVTSQLRRAANENHWSLVRDINKARCSAWLDSLDCGDRTKRNYKEAINGFNNWLFKVKVSSYKISF